MLEKLESSQARRPVPFYWSYAAFLRAIKALKDKGFPRRLTPRTLAPLLGDEASRIVTHFIAMEWVDEMGAPSDDLKKLVDAFGEDRWSYTVSDVIKRSYHFVPQPWEELTAGKLHEAFMSYTGRGDARILTSAETFFLSLALVSGVNLPDRLYLRANRAHTEAKRQRGDDQNGSAPSIEESAERKRPEAVAAVTKQKSQGSDWLDQIVKLSTLLGDGNLTEQERAAITVTISVLARRMNAA